MSSHRLCCVTLLALLALVNDPNVAVAQRPVGRAAKGAASPRQGMAATLALTGVTVIDVTDGRRLAQQTVVIVGNRIQYVGPANQATIPSGARTVAASGQYVVPGFWDMHAHVDDSARQLYPLFVANGVTGVREMAQRGDFPDSFRVWQHEVAAGATIGPRVIGPSADLHRIFAVSGIAKTPENAVHIIDSLKAAGDPFVKFHAAEDNRLFLPLIHEAKQVGLPMVGHLPTPEVVPNIQAIDSGLLSVEHINPDYDCVQRPDKPAISADSLEKECAAVARPYLRNDTWLTPTITVDYYRYFLGEYGDPAVFPDYQAYLRKLYSLGIRNFLTGTDCNDHKPHCGFALLQELVLLGESGLPPLIVLQAATLHPAQYLHGTDSLGTVAAGKLADLVLLDADPLVDIHNVLKIRAVVANGRYLDRPALNTMDPDAAESAKSFAAQWTGSKRLTP